MKYKRIFTIIVDSLGVGEMPDCKAYGDENVDTLGHLSNAVESFNIPNMQRLGFANLHPIGHVEPLKETEGYYAKMMELSNGKDTMTGHWEIMGLHITKPFQTFTKTVGTLAMNGAFTVLTDCLVTLTMLPSKT